MGSRAPDAKQRNEQGIKSNPKQSGDFQGFGPNNTAFSHNKLAAIQRGNEYNLAREYRQAQENLVNTRSDEDRQITELTTARRSTLRGEGGRVRAGLRAAEQVYYTMQK